MNNYMKEFSLYTIYLYLVLIMDEFDPDLTNPPNE